MNGSLRPSETDIRAALSALHNSQALSKSPALQKMLDYIVEQSLTHEPAKISAYAIAVDVFGRNATFDPQLDPIVRVQAARLRLLLDSFYAGEGADQPIRITIPKGAYIARFNATETAPGTGRPPEADADDGDAPDRMSRDRDDDLSAMPAPARVAPSWHRALAWTGAGLLCVLVLWAFVRLPSAGTPQDPSLADQHTSTAVKSSAPSLPTIQVGHRPGTAESRFSRHLIDQVTLSLSRFEEINVQTATSRQTSDLDERGALLHYSLELSVSSEPGQDAKLRALLTHTHSKRVVWGRIETVAGDVTAERVHGLAASIIRGMASPYGIVYSDIIQRTAGELPKSCMKCVRIVHNFLEMPQLDRRQQPQQCLEREAVVRPGFALGHSLLATVLARSAVHLSKPDATLALQRANQAAQEAIRLKPDSPQGRRALMHVAAANGDFESAVAEGAAAMMLNPLHGPIEAEFGLVLVSSGKFSEGLARLDSAISQFSWAPPHWHLGAFVAANATGNTERAYQASLALRGAEGPDYLAAVLIGAHTKGDHVGLAAASREWQQKAFKSEPFGGIPDPVRLRLLSQLRAGQTAKAS